MRVSKQPEERRAELVAVARRLFDQNGVDKTRVSDIVKAVGVAQGVFYYYYPSKEAIVDVVVRQVCEELAQKVEAVMRQNAPFGCKMAGLVELYLGLIDQFVSDDAERLPGTEQVLLGTNPPVAEAAGMLKDCIVQLVEAAATAGEIPVRYPRQTVQVLLYGLHRLAQDALPGREVIYTLAEQALGLAPGELLQWAGGPP